MSNASSKRSVMTLFSNKNDIYCHQVKIVLAEKGVAYENEEVDLQALSEDLMELNPYGTLPTLVDRDLVLFSSQLKKVAHGYRSEEHTSELQSR